jgi:uncharacterized repeat protein (TIGR04042 family)
VPELTFDVRWPDGQVQSCYSPSLVVHDHLVAGHTYTVRDFARRATLAMDVASERVREKYGFACTSAAATTDQITAAAASYDADEWVTVVRIWPPLPDELAGTSAEVAS